MRIKMETPADRLNNIQPEMVRKIIDSIYGGIAYIDETGYIRYHNKFFGEYFLFENESATGKHLWDINGKKLQNIKPEICQWLLRGHQDPYCNIISWKERFIEIKCSALEDDERYKGFVFFSQDVTDKENAKTNLYQQACMDGLTQLNNRQCFNRVFNELKDKLGKNDEYVALIMIDIDDLKYINDTFGHLQGDQIIRNAAKILQDYVRCSDTVFRYGGDEFVILITESTDELVKNIIKRIERACQTWNAEHANIHDHICLSMGYAMAHTKEDMEKLILWADQMMYQHKRERHMKR